MARAFEPKTASPSAAAGAVTSPASTDGLEISFRPDPSLYDGRFANVGWLQELPKQVTNLSWDNAALMSLNTMEQQKLEENSAVEIDYKGAR